MRNVKLNPSLLDKYQDCPACFAGAWRARQGGHSWSQEPKNYCLALGAATHEVIAGINKSLIRGEDFPATDEATDRYFNPSHFGSKEHACRARFDMASMISHYGSYLADYGLSVAAAEHLVSGSAQVSDDIMLVLTGRIDAILTDTSHTVVSLDAKTGKVLARDALLTRLSTGAYRCLTMKQHPDAERIQVTQLSLTTGLPVTAELGDTQRQVFKESVFRLARSLARDPSALGPDFAPAEGCAFCNRDSEPEPDTLAV